MTTFALCTLCGTSHAEPLSYESADARCTPRVPVLLPRGTGFVRYTGPAFRPDGEMTCWATDDS